MSDESQPAAKRLEHPPGTIDADAADHQGLGERTTVEVLPARGPLRTMLRWLGVAEQAAGTALVVVILVLVLIQVAQRYLPGGGWAWTGEIARFSMVWATFVLAGYLMAHDSHIAIKVVDYVLPVRALAAVQLVGHVLIAATATAFVYATYDFMTTDRGQVTAAAEIPFAVIYSVVAFGFASTTLRAIVAIVVLDLPVLRNGAKVVA